MRGFDALLHADFGSLMVAGIILTIVGRAIADIQTVRQWQCFCGATMFLGVYVRCASRLAIDPDQLAAVTIRAVLLAWLAFQLGGLVGIAAQAISHVVGSPFWSLWHAWKSRRKGLPKQKRYQPTPEELRYQREAQERAEQFQRAEAERRRLESQQLAEEQRRREQARFRCETLYDRHRVAIQNSIPWERVRGYLDSYLADTYPAAVVEQRADELERLISDCVREGGGLRQRFESLDQLALHFTQRKVEVTALGYDKDVKESILAALAIQEETAIREFLAR